MYIAAYSLFRPVCLWDGALGRGGLLELAAGLLTLPASQPEERDTIKEQRMQDPSQDRDKEMPSTGFRRELTLWPAEVWESPLPFPGETRIRTGMAINRRVPSTHPTTATSYPAGAQRREAPTHPQSAEGPELEGIVMRQYFPKECLMTHSPYRHGLD